MKKRLTRSICIIVCSIFKQTNIQHTVYQCSNFTYILRFSKPVFCFSDHRCLSLLINRKERNRRKVSAKVYNRSLSFALTNKKAVVSGYTYDCTITRLLGG